MRLMPMDESGISRRLFLVGAGSAVAAGALGAPAANAAAPGGSFHAGDLRQLDSPAGMLDVYVRLSGDTSGKPYYGAYSGHLFAVQPDSMVRALCGFTGFGTGSEQRQPDGSYHHLWHEVGYYTDLRTGKVLDRWKNPLNDAWCDVMHIHNRSVNMVYSSAPVRPSPPGMEIAYANLAQIDNPARPYGLPYTVIGDQVSVFSDGIAYVPNPLDPKVWVRESAGKMMSVAEFNMLTGSLKEALDPAVTSASCNGSWTRIGTWLPWMLLGQRPGHLYYRSATRKLRSVDELAPEVVAYTKQHYPEFLEPPTDFNMPMESSWEVFKADRKPSA